MQSLYAISPVDGRYAKATEELQAYFSEFALIKYRVWVEIEYFIFLVEKQIGNIQIANAEKFFQQLHQIIKEFSQTDALHIKEIEKTTNHDVKAVEYFLREKFDSFGEPHCKEWIHFGLTSQDVNNTATPMLLRDAHEKIMINQFKKIIFILDNQAQEWMGISMLAHTHGQPASPTKLGKEWGVFIERISLQLKQLATVPFAGKFGGATGNFNAHKIAFPAVNWIEFGNEFLQSKLNIQRSQTTTQIEHYDYLAAFLDNYKRINTILIDFCRDIWAYISMNYFKQKIKEGEVGSSAMPHKVNPIDFENAEGNFGIANALFEHLSSKLPISRLQRDLTDSTVLRNLGVPFAHTLIGLKSMEKGLQKLLLNENKIAADLDENWAIVAEAIQTILRRENYPDPYNALKALTRKNEKITAFVVHQFIDELEVNELIKSELKAITPANYTGVYS